jgi:Zn-dependent peptidase ImmA (M78 family)
MTVRWERFAGSTDIFAVRLSFIPDPDHGAAIEPEESASWGGLQLWVKGKNLCTYVDQGELLQSVHWYMLPFLEWVADSWNPLLHEERLPNRNIADTAVESLTMTRNAPALAAEADVFEWEQGWYEWRARHALQAARAGGLFPNVVLRRLRDYIEISWDDEHAAGTPVGFRFNLAVGSELLDPKLVAQPLYDLTLAAVGHLLELAPHSQRLTDLQAKLQSLPGPTQHDVRLRWLAGLPDLPRNTDQLQGYAMGSQESWPDIADALRDLGSQGAADAALSVDEAPLVVVGSCHAALLFGSVTPTVSETDVQTLARVLIEQYSSYGNGDSKLEKLSKNIMPDESSLAWEQGYDLAESLHDDLNLTGDWIDVMPVVDLFGIQIMPRRLDDTTIRACSMVGPQHKPTIVINESWRYSRSATAARFTIAHELCHLLYDRTYGRKLAVASGPWAPRNVEKRANAFAAMFLMPPSLVRRAVADSPDPIPDIGGVTAVAQKLHVSIRAAIEHLCNLTLMTESERDDLLLQLSPDQ